MATVIFGEGGAIWTLTTDRGRLAPWVATGTLITQVISMEDLKNGRKCWIEKLTFNQFWKGL